MDKIAAFDTLYTNNHIQMCKILLPSLPKDKQYFFAVLIKFWELNYVIKCGQTLLCHPDCNSPCKQDYQSICKDILPYCNPKEADTIRTMLQLLDMMDTVQTIAPLLDLIKQMQPESGEDSKSVSISDIGSLFSMGDPGKLPGDSPGDFLKNILGDSVSPEFFDLLGSFLKSSDYRGCEAQEKTSGLDAEESDSDVFQKAADFADSDNATQNKDFDGSDASQPKILLED